MLFATLLLPALSLSDPTTACPPGSRTPYVYNQETVQSYVPCEVGAGHPMHGLTVFYPLCSGPEDAPPGGWPVVLYSGASAFKRPLNGVGGEGPLEAIPLGSELLNVIDDGYVLVSVGTTGIDGDPNENIFYPYGSPQWNDPFVWYAEKDITWARQWVEANKGVGQLNLNTDLVIPWGTSAGAVYGAFLALGEERVFDPALLCPDSQLLERTHCAALIAWDMPAWFPSFLDGSNGTHWEDSTMPGTPANKLMDADPEHVASNSPSRWIRELNSQASQGLPVFLAYDEDTGYESGMEAKFFQRVGGGTGCGPASLAACDPPLTNEFAQAGELHRSWSGAILKEDLYLVGGAASFGRSRLLLSVNGVEDIDVYDAFLGLPEPYGGLADGFFTDVVSPPSTSLLLAMKDWLDTFVRDPLTGEAPAPLPVLYSRNNKSDKSIPSNPECLSAPAAPVAGTDFVFGVDFACLGSTATTAQVVFSTGTSFGTYWSGSEILIDLGAITAVMLVDVTCPSKSIHTPAMAYGVPFFAQALANVGGTTVLTNALDMVAELAP